MAQRSRRPATSLLCFFLLWAVPGEGASTRVGRQTSTGRAAALRGLPAALPPSQLAAAACVPAPAAPVGSDSKGRKTETAAPSPADVEFLDDLQHRAFLYFWEQTDPGTGLTKDRAENFADDAHGLASIAATGFALTALAVAEKRGWLTREQAYARALTCLRHLRDRQPHVRGWFHHFMAAATGEPAPHSEVSSMDTALLLAGALSIGQHFAGTEVERLAQEIYERVDFPWMMTDGGAKPAERTLSMGWTPQGFLKTRWDGYSEHLILYMLGLGSPTHPLPIEAWRAWRRPEAPLTAESGSLFTHQYSQLWLDLRNWKDDGHDYFDHSVQATLKHREAAIAAQGEFKTYGPQCWGWTACDGPEGYRGYGAYPGRPEHDGTIAPAAAGGSTAFTPELSISAMRWMKERHGAEIWGRYGFSDAFNSDPRWKERFNAAGLWRSANVVGIDQGAIFLAVENARSEGVWKTFMELEPVRRAFERAKSGR